MIDTLIDSLGNIHLWLQYLTLSTYIFRGMHIAPMGMQFKVPFPCAKFTHGVQFFACTCMQNLHPSVKVHLLRVHMVLNKFRLKWQ